MIVRLQQEKLFFFGAKLKLRVIDFFFPLSPQLELDFRLTW